jgi:4-hydroxy-4-methyl-2-oxoglutarate aldolase
LRVVRRAGRLVFRGAAAQRLAGAVTPLIERLRACYTGAVHDVLRSLGHDTVVLPPDIKAIAPGTRLAGPVWTVSGRMTPCTRDESLLGWCTLLSRAPGGHVVVCQPGNREIALMGELSAQTLRARGVLGYVVDGGSRDTDLVLEQSFPVFCAFLTPADIVERWLPERYGEPIRIGDVDIATGDWLLGDRDGVVVIPGAVVEDVVRRTEEVVATESDMRRALLGGMDPVEAYLQFGKF